MYLFCSLQQSYFLVELLTTHSNTFDITVPTTNSGTRLLCSIVDNVEALIDEWFPGLRDIDVINGAQLVTPLSLCPFCNGELGKCTIENYWGGGGEPKQLLVTTINHDSSCDKYLC